MSVCVCLCVYKAIEKKTRRPISRSGGKLLLQRVVKEKDETEREREREGIKSRPVKLADRSTL